MDTQSISKRVKDLMKENRITQGKLAEKTGFQQSVISEMLNGKRNIIPLVEKSAVFLGVTPEYLITGYNNIAKDSDGAINCDNLSADDKISLMKEMNALYEKHQSLLQEAQNIMRTIIEINKRILISNC